MSGISASRAPGRPSRKASSKGARSSVASDIVLCLACVAGARPDDTVRPARLHPVRGWPTVTARPPIRSVGAVHLLTAPLPTAHSRAGRARYRVHCASGGRHRPGPDPRLENRRMHRFRPIALALLLAIAAPVPLQAAEETSPSAEVLTSGFLYAHPDLKHRLEGMQRFEQGKFAEALEQFTLAAHWADKFAQAMVAEMHWTGSAPDGDRAAAYAWMDLAAERGYPSLVAKRERYWSDLDATERRRAIAIGEGLYA